MKFLTSGEQLLPGGLTHGTVSGQAVAALEPLNSGGSPGAELSVRADLLPQRVELLLDEPDGAARLRERGEEYTVFVRTLG